MNCAWCGVNDDGSDSHGICNDCMISYFGVSPVSEDVAGEAEEGHDQAA